MPADNQVFFYVYVLPYYLRAVLLLTEVGCGLLADFGRTRDHLHDTLILYANFLISIHDLIAGSITGLLPDSPPWSTPVSVGGSPAIGPLGQHVRGMVGNFQALDFVVQLNDMTAYWGAVEIFSGVSSVRTGTIPAGSQQDAQVVLENGAYQKLKIRVLREKMTVYANTGMRQVASTINALLGLAGESPFPPHKFSAWSFRDIITELSLPADFQNFFHLSVVAAVLRDNDPSDTSAAAPNSFRNLLEPS